MCVNEVSFIAAAVFCSKCLHIADNGVRRQIMINIAPTHWEFTPPHWVLDTCVNLHLMPVSHWDVKVAIDLSLFPSR